ncbi:MAG: hypothetical protein AAGA96_09595 [Verrucomicrobiota bacterium]
MKGFFITVLIIGGLGAAGYFLWEPYLKPMLDGGSGQSMSDESLIGEGQPSSTTSTASAGVDARPSSGSSASSAATPAKESSPPKSEVDRLLAERYPMPEIIPLMEIVNNWANVPDRAFPPEITSSEPVIFELVVNGQVVGGSTVDPGIPLKPIRLVGDQLIVASLANATMNNQIHVDKTDFKQRITRRYDDFVSKKKAEVEAMRSRVKQVVESDPAKMALLTGKRPPAVAASDASDARFNIVKQSLMNGEVSSAKPEEAKSFTWNGTETVGGAFPGTYETVTVRFVVDTIFGRFPVEYKALIQGNRVVGWIDPITEDRV